MTIRPFTHEDDPEEPPVEAPTQAQAPMTRADVRNIVHEELAPFLDGMRLATDELRTNIVADIQASIPSPPDWAQVAQHYHEQAQYWEDQKRYMEQQREYMDLTRTYMGRFPPPPPPHDDPMQ